MPSNMPIESRTRHPVLGPAVAVLDDRRRTRLRLIFWIAMIPLCILGVSIGNGDLAAGNTLLGVAQISGAIVLVLYSARATVVDAQRLTHPICLEIARDGFELFPGKRAFSRFEVFPSRHPIPWSEVSTISDPRSPAGQPRNLRAQLDDPQGFADREALSPVARLMLRINRGNLILGGGFSMPVAEVERLMRRQLAEFRRSGSATAGAPARPRGRRARRAGRNR